MIRSANAKWQGSLKEGKGTISVQSKAFVDQPYGFQTRFEDKVGTNPEELIAAAHASCFSMALSSELGKRDVTPDAIETSAAIDFADLTLKKSTLTTTVRAQGASRSVVEEAAAAAKEGCPISKVLDLQIELELTVEV